MTTRARQRIANTFGECRICSRLLQLEPDKTTPQHDSKAQQGVCRGSWYEGRERWTACSCGSCAKEAANV